MKKILITAIMLIMTFSLAACGSNNNGSTSSNMTGRSGSSSAAKTNEDYYFNATVLDISGNKLAVKPDNNDNNANADGKLIKSDSITIDAGILETLGLKDIKVGDKVRVVYDKNTINDDYSKIDTVFTVYRVDDKGEIVKGE